MSITRCLAACGILVGLAHLSPASHADSWESPHTAIYTSASKEYRFTTIPPGEKSNPETDRAKSQCVGRLEQKQQDNTYKTVWEKPLSNKVSPVSALVCDSGKFVVTFDNWHSMGHGKNAVVVVGSEGKLIRELSLTDFLTPKEVNDLPHSVSSIWWGNGHTLDEKQGCVVLKVGGKDPFDARVQNKPKEVRILLETGKVVEENKEGEKKAPPPG